MITVPYVSNSISYGSYTHLKLASQTLGAQCLKNGKVLVVQQRAKECFESSLSQEELRRLIRGC